MKERKQKEDRKDRKRLGRKGVVKRLITTYNNCKL